MPQFLKDAKAMTANSKQQFAHDNLHASIDACMSFNFSFGDILNPVKDAFADNDVPKIINKQKVAVNLFLLPCTLNKLGKPSSNNDEFSSFLPFAAGC